MLFFSGVPAEKAGGFFVPNFFLRQKANQKGFTLQPLTRIQLIMSIKNYFKIAPRGFIPLLMGHNDLLTPLNS